MPNSLFVKYGWLKPLAPRNPHEPHRAATSLELLFDLIFVVAIATAGQQLHHSIIENHLSHGLTLYFMVFFALWWAWMNFSWFASAYDNDDVFYRIMTFVQIIGSLVIAAGIPIAFQQQDFDVIIIGYVIMRLGLVTQWFRVAKNDPERKQTALRYAAGIIIVQIGWLLFHFTPINFTIYLFLLLVIAELSVPIFAEAHNIPIPVTKEHDYSMDRNMWHLSHEGSDLEDPWNAPKDALFIVTNTPETAPDKAEYVELEFEQGVPVAVNGKKMSPATIVENLNEIGIRNGVGICDMVENRLVGMKSRGVYETPGGSIIYYAHNELENLCLDRATMSYKQMVGIKYSELVYDGMWFSPLREALAAFVDETQKTVTGTVRLKLYKGNIISAGAKSPYSLYSQEYVTFGADEVYNQADASGFINLFGLPLTVRALMKQGKLK